MTSVVVRRLRPGADEFANFPRFFVNLDENPTGARARRAKLSNLYPARRMTGYNYVNKFWTRARARAQGVLIKG